MMRKEGIRNYVLDVEEVIDIAEKPDIWIVYK